MTSRLGIKHYTLTRGNAIGDYKCSCGKTLILVARPGIKKPGVLSFLFSAVVAMKQHIVKEHKEIGTSSYLIIRSQYCKQDQDYVYALADESSSFIPMQYASQIPSEVEKRNPTSETLTGKAPHAFIHDEPMNNCFTCTLCNEKFAKHVQKVRERGSYIKQPLIDATIIHHFKKSHSLPVLVTRIGSNTVLLINQAGKLNPRVINTNIKKQITFLETLGRQQEAVRKLNKRKSLDERNTSPTELQPTSVKNPCISLSTSLVKILHHKKDSDSYPKSTSTPHMECTEIMDADGSYSCDTCSETDNKLYNSLKSTEMQSARRKFKFANHVAKHHPSCRTILMATNRINEPQRIQSKTKGKRLWLDQEGSTCWNE